MASARKRRAWSADNPGNIAIREELAAAALEAAGEALGKGDVLDAGCGTGWWLRRLADAGVQPARLHGIDLDAARVAAVRRAVPGAHVRQGNLAALPYADGRFAAVFLLTVLSSLGSGDAVDRAVGEIRRVLAPGGMVVIWEPRVPTPGNRATRLIRPADLRPRIGEPAAVRSLTVVPPLARRLGDRTERWYPRLARVPILRTHRLLTYRLRKMRFGTISS